MSVDNVRAAIERFLVSKKPQVLCIRGAWGTGKTYTWDDVLVKAVNAKRVEARKYAKASLFGLNSIKEIKREIFQSSIDIDQVGKPFDIKNVNNTVSSLVGYVKSALKFGSFVHEDALTAAIEVAALFARDQVILIDDLERKGEDLRSVDVLGYISQLRDDRACKIVLLLNDEELADEPDFNSYLEKVTDLYLRFEPSGQEIARIAIPESDKVSMMVRDNAVALGINNVRVIRKIHAFVKDVEPIISKYSGLVTENAAAVMTLLGWSYFQPTKAPPLDYLKRVHTYSPSKEDEALNIKWRDLLLKYRYIYASDFDLALLSGIENGYLDSELIDKHASELHHAAERNKVENEMRDIWNELHYSFTKSAESVLDKFFNCFSDNIEYMSLTDVAVLDELFRELGDDRADQIVDRYIEIFRDRPEAFDFERLERFGNKLTAPARQRIAAAKEAQTPKLGAEDLIIMLGSSGFDKNIYESASKLPVDDYIRIFRTYEGEKLSDILSGIRQYLNLADPEPQMSTIMDKAGQALRRLAAESPINKRRAMTHGLVQRLDAIEAEDNEAH